MKYWFLFLFVFGMGVGCGFNGDQRLTTNDSTQHILISGDAYSYIVVRLEFIQQINDLCRDANIQSDYATEALYKKAVADCTFHQLSILNIDPAKVKDFQNAYCEPGADLSGFTPQQASDVLAACAVVAGS